MASSYTLCLYHIFFTGQPMVLIEECQQKSTCTSSPGNNLQPPQLKLQLKLHSTPLNKIMFLKSLAATVRTIQSKPQFRDAKVQKVSTRVPGE